MRMYQKDNMDYIHVVSEVKEGKNVHLTHLEDSLFLDGSKGASEAIEFLKETIAFIEGEISSVVYSVKWDGAPAVICGINPGNNKFFVGTKGVFAKDSKACYTLEDIDKWYSDKPDLANKLRICFNYIPEIHVENSGYPVLQGDLLYIKSDLKKQTINEIDYIIFKPNTIIYAVPEDSKLAKIILNSQLGIIFHTGYKGEDLESMVASYGISVNNLETSSDVWYQDAKVKKFERESNDTKYDEKVADLLYLVEIAYDAIDNTLLDYIANDKKIRDTIIIFLNSQIRTGDSFTMDIVDKFIKFVDNRSLEGKLTSKNAEYINTFVRENSSELFDIFGLHHAIANTKDYILKHFKFAEDISSFIDTEQGLIQSPPEGVVAIDTIDNKAVKLVNRAEFSKFNFLTWPKKT